MKLYTEEQVNKIAAQSMSFGSYDNSITPIELPSNEQIEELSKNTNFEYDYFNNGFVKGAEYIKEQILKQNQ